MDVRKLKDKAQEHLVKHRFDKAAEVFTQICEADPKDLQTRQRLGDALRSAGRAKDAVRTYQSVADSYAQDGQLLKAIAVNKLLLEVDPTHTETQQKLAALYAQRAPVRARAVELPPQVEAPPATAELTDDEETTQVGAPPSAAAPPVPAMPPVVPRTPERVIAIAIDEDDDETDVSFRLPKNDVDDPAAEKTAVGPSPLFDVPDRAETGKVFEVTLEEDPFEVTTVDPAAAETVAKIPDSPLFESLDPAAFVDLLQRCNRRPFVTGDVLIKQGDPARSFFVISSGLLAVAQSPVNDPTVVNELARLGPGDFFGELALVSESPRIASVVATTDGEALEFPGEVLRELIAAHPAAEAAIHKFTRARLLQNAMATSGLFRPFDRDQRKHLIARFVIRDVPAGTKVLTEGQPSDGLYVVMQGRYAVESQGKRMATLGVGEIFGEISLLNHAGAGADVTAETGGRVLRLPRKAFDELILTHPQVLEMISNLADERQQLNEGVASGRVACDTEGLILI